MDTAGMVGSMGLTFFCNKCVEVFYKFSQEGIVSPELKETCGKAISGFTSLKWPVEQPEPSGERTPLFNTNGELKSFEQVLEHEDKEATKMLDELIAKLEFVVSSKPIRKRKTKAKELQDFFDTLGDYSFYATRDCLREAPTMSGI